MASEQEDFERRKTGFMEGFGKLRQETQCDFISVPQFVPQENGTWSLIVTPQIADLKAMTPSPIIV